MQTLKFKTILYSFVGIFLFGSHVMVFREIAAGSEYPVFSALFFVLFLTFWTGIGVLFSPFKNADKAYFIFPILCISPATLLSLTAVNLLNACYTQETYITLAMVNMLACFPQGLILGLIMASSRRSISPEIQKYAALFGAVGYLVAALALYPLGLFSALTNPLFYTITANIFILATAVTAFRVKKVHSIRYWVLTLSTVIIAANFLLVQLEKFSNKNYFEKCYPDYSLVKTYRMNYARVTLLKEKKADKYILLENSQITKTLPDDGVLYKTNVLPLVLQKNKDNLRILALGGKFSQIPSYMASMPFIKQVTHVIQDEPLLPLNVLRKFSPRFSPKLKFYKTDIKEYLAKRASRYDVIVWLTQGDPSDNFANLLKLSSRNLTKSGILAIPAVFLFENNSQRYLDSIFKNKLSLPGKSIVYAYSNKKLTGDLSVLEKRLEKLDTGENKLFPLGTFSVVYSIPSKLAPVGKPLRKSNLESNLLESFSQKKVVTNQLLILLACAATYFLLRFLMLRRKSLYDATALFENGFCTMLLMTSLMSLFAQYTGSYYYNFGFMLMAVCGVPFGFFLSQFKILRLAVIVSIAILILSVLGYGEYYTQVLPILAFVNFICCGIIISAIYLQHTHTNIRILAIHFIACALGAGLVLALMMAHYNILSVVFMIILFRIPLTFSKMSLGKLDRPGSV